MDYTKYTHCLNRISGGHIEIMLIIEMAKIELIGGHIGIKLIIEMAKIEINRRPYWIYANYRDYWIGINWRPYWIIVNIHIA